MFQILVLLRLENQSANALCPETVEILDECFEAISSFAILMNLPTSLDLKWLSIVQSVARIGTSHGWDKYMNGNRKAGMSCSRMPRKPVLHFFFLRKMLPFHLDPNIMYLDSLN
ncbi:hypothetical protein I3760_13G056700 [Carya illinoinensis]|nr:hypothetical protein I3760_13G056700 [Carya illinoinensis]